MKKLLKTYRFNSDMQYIEMIAESFINGQHPQALEQFKAMPKGYRKKVCALVASGTFTNEVLENNISTLINLI